jgi:hypothetical protein
MAHDISYRWIHAISPTAKSPPDSEQLQVLLARRKKISLYRNLFLSLRCGNPRPTKTAPLQVTAPPLLRPPELQPRGLESTRGGWWAGRGLWVPFASWGNAVSFKHTVRFIPRFRKQTGLPSRTWGLSALLDSFPCWLLWDPGARCKWLFAFVKLPSLCLGVV